MDAFKDLCDNTNISRKRSTDLSAWEEVEDSRYYLRDSKFFKKDINNQKKSGNANRSKIENRKTWKVLFKRDLVLKVNSNFGKSKESRKQLYRYTTEEKRINKQMSVTKTKPIINNHKIIHINAFRPLPIKSVLRITPCFISNTARSLSNTKRLA